MRIEWLACFVAALSSVSAQAEAELVRVAAEQTLYVDEASSLTIEVDLPSDAAEPLLLTVHAEGTALDVVRGRVSRENARKGKNGQLSFAVPVVGRAPGSSIVRAHVRFFRCRDTCQAQQAVAALAVDVRMR